MVADRVPDDPWGIGDPVVVGIGVLHAILHVDGEGNQVQVAGHVFLRFPAHDGLHFPDRPLVDPGEGRGSEVVQSRLQVLPVDLAEKAAVADRAGGDDRKTVGQVDGDDQGEDRKAQGRPGRDGAEHRTAPAQALPRLCEGSGDGAEVPQQVRPGGSQRAGAEPPDNQCDECKGAYVLQEQDVRRARGAKGQGKRQAGREHQHVHGDGHDDRHGDYHADVDGGEARAELVHDDRDGSRIRRRARHQKNQRRSGAEALGDQRGGDRRACGRAYVERNAYQDHHRVGRPAGVLVVHQVVGNRQVEQSSRGDAEEQREQDVVGEFRETVVKDVPENPPEARQIVVLRRFDLRSVGRFLVDQQFLAIEVRLDPVRNPPVADLGQERPEPVPRGNFQLRRADTAVVCARYERFVLAVIVLGAVVMVVIVLLALLTRTAIVPDETYAKDAGDDRGDEADDRSNHRRHPTEEGIRNEDRIRAGFGSGYQERHAGRSGSSLPPHLGDHGHHRTAAKRHGHAHGRAGADRLETVVTKPPENRLTGNEDVKQAREEQPEQQHGRQQEQRHPHEVEELGQQAPQLYHHFEPPIVRTEETRHPMIPWTDLPRRRANYTIAFRAC